VAKLTEEAKKIIAEAGLALISTSSRSSRANVSIKGSFRILDDEHIVFFNIDSPRTIINLGENPQLSALVFDPKTGRKCRIWGKAEVISRGPLYDSLATALGKLKEQQIVQVTVGEVEVF
jgi:predicted pyridoxine 5'-phosphate oxidase superfamily flavin-nucleotide-binding protein